MSTSLCCVLTYLSIYTSVVFPIISGSVLSSVVDFQRTEKDGGKGGREVREG